ncbi:hypothetical protein cypCar_00035472 [Cyprinus carpio]|nr:hypothetical protein cypCar_00035472 [Cyprinus carpio]
MMSDLKRQMSWHEDFARNLSRFFSRNKSADSEGSGSEVREADGSAVACSAEQDPDQTPEKHLNAAQEDPSQESQSSDVPDGNTASQTEDGSRGDARDSAPPSASTVPPADGFLRRLGSLFHFSRAEAAGAQRERRSDADSSSLTTAQTDTQTSAETLESRGGAEPRDPALTAEPSVCHSERTHTPSEEQTEEDRSDAVNIDAKESLEDKRRFDLACPPVVTYGTYRGLREVRKPKKKHHVELHSPISEGEEAIQSDSHEDETEQSQAEQSPPKVPVNGGQEHLAQNHHDTQSSESSLIVDSTDDLVPGSQTCWTLEEFELKQTVKMEASETECDVLLTCEPKEGSEAVLFEGSEGRGDRGTNAEHQFGVVLTDQALSAVLEETLAGHVDCSRSPPSSGAPISSQNENQDALEYLFEEKNSDGTASHIKLLSEESLWLEQHTGDVSVCEANLNGSGGTSDTAPSAHQESLQQSQTLSVMGNHKPEKTEGSDEQEQACQVSQAGIDSRVLPSLTEVDHPSQWATVQAFRCDVTDDQSLSPATLKEHFSVNRADAGTSVVSVSGHRIHLDPSDSSSRTAAVVPQHARSHDLDLHHVDGGFAIISEEEESDMVFVNDMGPLHSPSTRRAKAYPFSLSPIYEEEFGREEASGQQTLQVPPATEEEQRSVEQPASSILSLLQSVSEKLQSSVVCSSVEESVHALLSRDDSEDDDEDSSIPQSHQLTEAKPERETAHDTPDRLQEERECDDTLFNIGKNTNTPFYQYLKSGIMPSEIGEFGKVNPRPAAVLVYESQSLSGERRDICDDVEDAGRDLFAHRGTLHALRGCWLLYVDSWFRGSCVLLEEGQTVRTRGGSQQDLKETREPSRTDVSDALTVDSIRTLLKDDSVPEIHLYPSSSQTVRLHSASDLTGAPVLLSDLCVRTGCWLVYEQPGFSGRSAVLETDGRVTPLLQNSLLSCVKSLRPLKMGGLQVSRPLDPKVVLFEEPQFQGGFRELLDHAPRLTDSAASLRVTDGWRSPVKGSEVISVCWRRVNTQTVRVCSAGQSCGSSRCAAFRPWVAYSERCFTGQQYVLEKGHYPGLLDWGDGRSSARSLRPIHREVCRITEPKFLLRVYSQTRFCGQSREFESGVPDCGVPGVASLRVIRGSWLLFDEERYSGNQYILGEGHYPDLTSCGCTSTAIKSLKPIPYSFAEPSVSLFSLSGFEGLEDSLCSDAENMSHFFIQSLRVHSGLWVAYEYALFKGRQMLLQQGGYPVWAEHSGWDTIGSLKPLRQPKAYIQLRSRALGSVLTSESLPDGSFPAKLFLSPADRSLDTQRWIFTHGLLKNTARMGCLSVIGAKACAGAPVALWEEHGRINQRWSLNEDGSICSHLNRSLALDLRGGCGVDRDHLILSPLHADSVTQTWDIDVL